MRARDAVRAVGDRLGPVASGRVRDAALAWGRATWGLRPGPGIVVVGAQRCGTTTMFRLMAAHPDLRRPTLSKGTSYFDDEYARPRDWYLGHFPVRRGLPGASGKAPIAFECSGYYLFHPLAAERIARDLPDAHVVVLLRDPVSRALSAHRHEVARGFDTLPLREALDAEGVRTAGESERLRHEPGYRSFAHRHHAYLQRGEYAPQVRRYLTALGPSRVHVVDADDFFTDTRGRFLQLQEELGLTPWVPTEVEAWNARPGPPPDDELRRSLRRHFEPYDGELAELIGREPSWRRVGAAS
ncbi:sulfotransferase family protein [Nocardioides plantarum]|uniref:Sulfotransferase n=1 Tax=Nocardioides plantarum TaxID=29299 RepID=A0ABV5KBB1_9ACTN|nr:sulfotransferase [Nocardioides plantarum]